jgi:hypothetical protein
MAVPPHSSIKIAAGVDHHRRQVVVSVRHVVTTISASPPRGRIFQQRAGCAIDAKMADRSGK